jgi:hypothetical protein
MVTGLILLALLVIVVQIQSGKDSGEVLSGPQLHARLERLLSPYEGAKLTAAARTALEAQADAEFRDALTGVGLVPTGWAIRLDQDELLGPVARVHGPSGQVLSVAELERHLGDGSVSMSGTEG